MAKAINRKEIFIKDSETVRYELLRDEMILALVQNPRFYVENLKDLLQDVCKRVYLLIPWDTIQIRNPEAIRWDLIERKSPRANIPSTPFSILC